MTFDLAKLTPEEITLRVRSFPHDRAVDWGDWLEVFPEQPLASETIARALARTLRLWSATAPAPLRPSAGLGRKTLVATLARIRPFMAALDGHDLRSLANPRRKVTGALRGLFATLATGLVSRGPCTETGITSAMVLLTRGRFGPILDRVSRKSLGLPAPDKATATLDAAGYVDLMKA